MKRWKSPQSGGFAERFKHYFCHLLSKINYFCHLLHQKLKSSLKTFLLALLDAIHLHISFSPDCHSAVMKLNFSICSNIAFSLHKASIYSLRMCKIFSKKVNKSKVCSNITSDGFVFVAPLQLLVGPTTGANKKTVAHTHPHLVLQPLQCIGLLGFQRFWKVVDQYV